MMEYKLAILVREDLKLPKGKLAAQAAHAAVEAAFKANRKTVVEWMHSGQKKVVVKVTDLRHLNQKLLLAEDAGLCAVRITDAGRTVVAPGTITCGAIGPEKDEIVDRIINDLKLM